MATEKIEFVLKDLNWVKNNLNKKGKYVKPFSWCGEDMFIDFYQGEFAKSQYSFIVTGNLLAAHLGKTYRKSSISPFVTKISEIKYFKDGYVHYLNVEDEKFYCDNGPKFGDENSSFKIENARRIIKDVYVNDVKISTVTLDFDLDNGNFILNVENNETDDEIILCGIKLKMSIKESLDSNFILYEVARKNWNNSNIVHECTSLNKILYSEIMFTVFDIPEIINFNKRVKNIIIAFENKTLPLRIKLNNNGYQVINVCDNKFIKLVEISLFDSRQSLCPSRCRIIITGNNLDQIKNICVEIDK